jgi:hypothetical protein
MSRLQLILILTSAILALSSCKEQALVIAPEETPPPTISVSNLPEAFDLSLAGKNLTDTLGYMLSFTSDSLCWAFAVSGATSGSLKVQIFDTLGLALFQDSSYINIAHTKCFKSKNIPRIIRFIFSHFTGTAAFALHAGPSSPEAQDLLGAWEWTSSYVGLPLGRTLTPQTEGYTCQVYFMPDSTFAMFRNDSLLASRGTYSVSFDEYLSVTQSEFPFYGMKMVFFINDEGQLELYPYPWGFDAPVSHFIRRKG